MAQIRKGNPYRYVGSSYEEEEAAEAYDAARDLSPMPAGVLNMMNDRRPQQP